MDRPLGHERFESMGLWSRIIGASRQTMVLRNATNVPLEVMVEVAPDRYVLQPGDEMAISADNEGYPFDVSYYGDGVQVYANERTELRITINGQPVEPDWKTPGDTRPTGG